MENWPKYYTNQLIINSEKGVAIVCGWTKKEEIWKNLSPKAKNKVSVLGQLYSKEGINFIIRNTFLNPSVNYLIVTGKDISGSINSFKSFLFDKENSFIHEEIPEERVLEFMDYFSKNCVFIDSLEVNEFLEKLDIKSFSDKWTNNVHSFSDHIPESKEVFPCEEVGFRIEGKRIADVWTEVLQKINNFGFEKMSSYDEKQKELINIMTVIDGEDPDNPFIPDYFYFNQEDLINYYPQMMTDNVFPGIEYTYGSRFRNFKNKNQVELMIKELKRESFSRRAIALTWDVEKDAGNPKSPCLILIQTLIQNNKLYLTAYFRSNDMFRAWPQNAFGLLKIQKEIGEKLNIKLGKMAIISSSAHIYERDFIEAQKVIEKSNLTFNDDPRGSFIIEIVKKEIVVKHIDQSGNFLQEFRGKTACEIRAKINNFVSDINHALYLGSELLRAEKSIEKNEDFTQDQI